MEAYGLRTKTYDLCVANEITNGKQMNVTWYVNNEGISRVTSSYYQICMLSLINIWEGTQSERWKISPLFSMYFLLKRDM